MAPKAKIPSVIKCHSEPALSDELELSRDSLSLVETEETWDTIANALLRITALLNGGASEYPTTLISFIRSMYRPITSAAISERSRLSAAAVECITTLATELGPSFDPLVPLFVPTLLSICSRPNKVFISRAKAALHTIIDQTQLISLLPYFVDPLRDKSATLRLIAIESLLACVRSFNPPDLEKDARAKDIESAIKLTATDASADVRRVSRSLFEAYKILLPARVETFEVPLTPTMKKYLNIATSRPPSSQSTHTIPAKRPTSSMSSAPPKRVEPHPRPATSLAHHRSASSSSLAPSAPSSKLTRSRTEGTITPSAEPSVPGPSSKRKEDMPPPAIIPQHRPQGSEPTAPPERPVVRQEIQGPERPERPAEPPSSRSTTTQVQRPDPAQRPVHVPKPHPGPLRAEPTSIRERLLGRGPRVPLSKSEPQQAPPSRPTQEKQAMAEAPVVPKRSRLDSVRHGPKASAAIIAAKRAVTQVAGASSAVPETSRPTSAQAIAEKKERLTEGKKIDSKAPPTAGGKTGSSRVQGKKEVPRAGPSVSDRLKPSTSTRSTGKAGPESKAQKKEQPKADHPAVAGSEKEKPSHSSKGVPVIPPKKVVARTGGVTQPTLSQLARIKASEEEKGRRAGAKGTTKPLTIRRKGKAVPPKVTPNETEIPAAATTMPLPPSPEVRPVDVPLPESPVSAPLAVQEEQVAVPTRNDTEGDAAPVEEHPPTPTPVQVHPFGVVAAAKTPISALVHSIQRGFLFSPNSPLSPAQSDAEWEYPAWPGPPGIVLSVGEEPSFEGVEESTIKRPLMADETDIERRALTEMN